MILRQEIANLQFELMEYKQGKKFDDIFFPNWITDIEIMNIILQK